MLLYNDKQSSLTLLMSLLAGAKDKEDALPFDCFAERSKVSTTKTQLCTRSIPKRQLSQIRRTDERTFIDRTSAELATMGSTGRASTGRVYRHE